MGFFDRIRNSIRGRLDRTVEGLEQQNPEAVYQAAIEVARASAIEHRGRAASLAGQRDRLVERVEALERDAAAATAALHEAVDEGDDASALVLQMRVTELAEEIETRRAEAQTATEAADNARAAVADLTEGIRKLEAEQTQALASLTVSQAALELQEANSGMGSTPHARALDTVREAIDRLDGAADTPGTSRVTSREMAASSARAQLEALKRQRGLPASDDGDDD